MLVEFVLLNVRLTLPGAKYFKVPIGNSSFSSGCGQFAKAKVHNFDVFLRFVNKTDIARLDISMNNTNFMQSRQSVQQLLNSRA